MIALTDEQAECCLKAVFSCAMRVQRDLAAGRYGANSKVVEAELDYMLNLAVVLRAKLGIEVRK